VWDDVTIGDAAQLTRCIVADGVTIPPGASYADSAIVRADGRKPAPGERIEGGLLIADL
jgi:NDP-sugar pyrophosphorylase family protein